MSDTQTALPVGNDPAWLLFTDWCEASGNTPLPADPEALVEFLSACPAAASTLSHRVAAIDVAHEAATLPKPGDDQTVRSSLRAARGLDPRPVSAPRFNHAQVLAGLEAVLITGWPYGLVGRRDAALVVAVCVLELSRARAASLTLADVEETPRLSASGQPRTAPVLVAGRPVFRGPTPGSCPACAMVRWHRAAAFYARHGRDKVRRDMWGNFPAPARSRGRHACVNLPGRVLQSPPERAESDPLFSSIDRNGWLGSAPLTIRSVSPIVAAVLADGRLSLQAPQAQAATGQAPVSGSANAAGPTISHGEAIRRRRAALAEMENVERVLDELDAAADAAITASQQAVDTASGQLARLDELRGATPTAS